MFNAVPAAQNCPHAPLCEDWPVVVPHVPLGQYKHAERDVWLPHDPAGHGEHAVALAEPWYDAIGQATHPVLPFPAAYEPAGQDKQRLEAVAGW